MDFRLDEIYGLIHRLQPQALIGSNHHLAPNPGEDFQMFEKDLPGRNTKSFATKAENIGQLPLEVCETINGFWGFNLKDRTYKSKKKIVQYLVKAAGYNSNLLLNVGPMPNGRIQEQNIRVLKQVWEWLKIYGKTVYNTRGGPIKNTEEIASTRLGNTVYFHILDYNKKT
ncbi:alpha-L-fucosidase [Flavobacteriaceae bacterium]|nr:alpha-L-fucosidase [Flavobacteriaceae bacterium]